MDYQPDTRSHYVQINLQRMILPTIERITFIYLVEVDLILGLLYPSLRPNLFHLQGMITIIYWTLFATSGKPDTSV